MSDLFRLPGPGRFAAGLAALVRDGRSVLIRVPPGQRVPVLPAVATLLEAEGYPCHSLPPNQAPAAALAWALMIEDEGTDALLSHEVLRRGDVFLGEMDAAGWPAWQILLRKLEAAVSGWEVTERPRIVLQWSVDGTGPPPPQTDLTAVRTWRGCVGELDLKVHVGSVLLGREISSVQRRLLTEQIVRLSLWDPDLADRLLDLTPAEFSDPVPALRDYARQRGWTIQTALAWELGTEEAFEGASQVHSAQAALIGRTELIRRRQWEAQASVVLPLIDRLRCDLVEDGFGFFRRVIRGIARPADLYDQDIGSLCHLLRTHDGPKDLKQRAEGLRWYRNELSHLRPLPFDSLYNYLGWPA